jgi:hypothetical protein
MFACVRDFVTVDKKTASTLHNIRRVWGQRHYKRPVTGGVDGSADLVQTNR